jgi:thiosulfate/3-mercaptopyruvate sulfurtransferase
MSVLNAPQPRIRLLASSGISWKLLLASQLIYVTACATSTPQEKQKKPTTKPMLIQSVGLEGELREPALRILDTRSQEAYGKGHIPGAVRVDVGGWQALGKSAGGLQNSKAWGEKVSELGIGPDTRVVVYGNSLPDTARIWWMLKYLGLENVEVLDGGWDLWQKEGRTAESAVPRVAATRFVPKFDASRLEEMDPLRKSLGSETVTLVDARSPSEFTGKEVRGNRGGHIAGATNLEWKELLAGDGRFKTPEELRQLFRERRILPDRTAVCY